MTLIQTIVDEKSILCKERDLTAELYNLWITKLHDFEDIPEKYEQYMKMIDNLEPYANMLKEAIREKNSEICKHYGVNSISDTPHSVECINKYGYDRPNGAVLERR